MPEDEKPVAAARTTAALPAEDGPAPETGQPENPPVLLSEPDPDAAPDRDAVPDLQGYPIAATPPPALPSRRRSAGVAAPLLGGALAAVLGFGLSHYNILNLRNAVDPAELASRLAEIEQQQQDGFAAAQSMAETASADAASALTAARQPPEALAALTARVDGLDQALSDAAASGGTGDAAPAIAALSAELDQLRAILAASPPGGADAESVGRIVDEKLAAWQEAAAAQLAAEAESTKALALRDAALLSLREATVTGAPYGAALAALAPPQVPEVLARHAETGLPTLAHLAETYPEAARRALDASLRVTAGSGVGDKLWAFLRIQTGARSLSPQEGDDPDAVLSRAEAALATGDLPATLTLIATLPPEGQAELADWAAKASDLIAARDAIAAFSAGADAPAAP